MNFNSKQRANLRAMASTLEPVYIIGKGNVTDNVIKGIDEVLEKRELIKITVLETSFMSARGACEAICEEIGAEPVQCIGNKVVTYRRAKDKNNRKIELPR
jgi:RNA-binding protein